jgi:hypothetical protein
MDHKEQHHLHHEKEREHKKKEHEAYERAQEKKTGLSSIHPAWFVGLGIVLVMSVVLLWTLFF